ncbi:MAG: glycosyltransferase family 2 protein [Chloroflexi bacterium]|nr:glycosyltransferase family 2 protein [Chloroflexota bacterium]
MMEASVIIPTYNRAGKLRRCLQALAGQTHPAADFEVLVVVDGSTDDTLEMLAALQTPFRLRVIPQSNAGQCAALNRGAAEAHGRICIFLDDDITVTPRFLEEHLRPHRSRDPGSWRRANQVDPAPRSGLVCARLRAILGDALRGTESRQTPAGLGRLLRRQHVGLPRGVPGGGRERRRPETSLRCRTRLSPQAVWMLLRISDGCAWGTT